MFGDDRSEDVLNGSGFDESLGEGGLFGLENDFLRHVVIVDGECALELVVARDAFHPLHHGGCATVGDAEDIVGEGEDDLADMSCCPLRSAEQVVGDTKHGDFVMIEILPELEVEVVGLEHAALGREVVEVIDDNERGLELVDGLKNVVMYMGVAFAEDAKVIEAHDVTKAYGDKLLFENLNFSLPQGGIVGVIGPNGAGKTTLFRLIMGLEKPDSGTFEVGETVKIGYVDQQHADIDPEKTVWEVISGGNELIQLGKRSMNSRAYVSRFNFGGNDQQKKAGVLSGGERNRMHLALTLKQEANVLLLDEPTNDIDVNTLRALEEGLENFAGCAVIISHDRWFLDRVATHILAFEGNSQVYFFEGSYSEYEENKMKRLGNVEPKRFRYKKLKA